MPYLCRVKRLIFKGMNNKPIKLIASDMDGTLLDSNGILNPEFFTAFEDLNSVFITIEQPKLIRNIRV